MNRLRKIVRSALSAVLIAGVVLSSSAIAPMTVTPAEAIAPLTILKAGLGGLGSIASSVGPSLVGKVLNLTGNSELADFFGLNTNQNLHKIMDDMEDVKTQLGDISEQINDLSDQLGATADHLESWTTLTSFQESYGDLSSTYDSNVQTIKRLMELQDDGDIDSDEFDAQVKQLMEELYNGGNLRSQVYAMGDAIMGEGTSFGGSPTEAYYQNMKQKDGITRDELINNYVAFSTSVYQDYVMAVMLTNGAMAYLASENGGNIHYESQIAQLSQQAQKVLAFLIDERKNLFPSNKIDGYDQALPNPDRTANDYNVVYENGKVKEPLELKDGKEPHEDGNGFHTFYEPSEQYLLLNVGEATAVKLYWNQQNIFDYNSNITWSSDNPNVAVVDEFGGVFATGVGTATLTAKYNDETQVEVQVDVVDVTSDGTAISTFTADPVTSTSGKKIGLSQLLSKIEGIDTSVADYTWTTTDSNSVVVNGDNVEVVGNSGGYSMVIGTRQVRYDTKYTQSTEIQKVVFPFYVDYASTKGNIYDYDDLMYHGYHSIDGTLQADLNARTPYGQIMAQTKIRTPLKAFDKSGETFSLNGDGHSIDLMGITLMDNMENSTVENLSIYSTTDLDSAAIVDELPTSGKIIDCDIDVTINGNQRYLGSAANESQGRIDGVNFYGTITNTYSTDDGDIVGKGEGCDKIPYNGELSTCSDFDYDDTRAFQYPAGTGGVVGRQDVNAEKNSSGEWEDSAPETGVYNCYLASSAHVNAYTNAGGIVGLAVGDWTYYNQDDWVNTDIDPDDSLPAPNAAYVKIYASVSRGYVTATANTGSGIAGGIVGYSVFADINGASVSASVKRETSGNQTKNGRTAGVSGIYLPSFATQPNPAVLLKTFAKGEGFKMENCVVDATNIQDIDDEGGNNEWGQSAFFFNRDWSSYTTSSYEEISQQAYEDRYLLWDAGIRNDYETYDYYRDLREGTDSLKEFNGVLESTGYQIEPLPDRTWDVQTSPWFTTTRENGQPIALDFKDSYVYGEPVVPESTKNVTEIYYIGTEGTDYASSTVPPTKVGTYIASEAPYNSGHEVNETFTITPRTVQFAKPTSTTLTYNGLVRTVNSPYITNLVHGDNVGLEVSGNSEKEVGNYTLTVNKLTGDDAANYKLGGTHTMSWSIVKSEDTDTDADAVVETIDTNLTGAMNSAGGDANLTLTGYNLENGVLVGLFDGKKLISQDDVIKVGDEWTSSLYVPANNTTEEKNYSLMVSYNNGVTWQEVEGSPEITVDAATEPEEPSVYKITADQTKLDDEGGAVTVTVEGDNISDPLVVGLFGEGTNNKVAEGTTYFVDDNCITSIDVPENTTDEDKTYTLKVSYDGGKTFETIEGSSTITVAGKGSSSGAAIQQIAIDHSNLNHAGGAVIVTVTGQNLASAPYVGLFDGNELLDKSVTKSNGDSYVAVLDVPANTVAETLSYSVRVSENGSTWLSTPVNYLTIAGDPNAEASEGDDHAVFVNTNDYGWLNVEPHRAEKGEKVVITVTPADGCELDEITLMDEQGYIMAAVALGPNQYSFTMPETAVSVAATFVQSSGHPSDSELPFYDVRTTDWFYEAVKFVYDENLMTGTGANAFSPNATTTRGMIVSILARLEGVTSAQSAGFADVNAGDWYATAVNWAASAGVVNGYEDNTFRPNTAITREQLAAILMNYASYKGENVSARANLSGYTDQPSSWAKEAMSWAVAEGLISGVTADTLQPQGAATRAQVAAILQRFLSE